MYEFISGGVAMASLVVGLFFFHFYRKVNDRFFCYFAAAFGSMFLERVILVLGEVFGKLSRTHYTHVYLIRLASFIMIAVAILDKNRTETAKK